MDSNPTSAIVLFTPVQSQIGQYCLCGSALHGYTQHLRVPALRSFQLPNAAMVIKTAQWIPSSISDGTLWVSEKEVIGSYIRHSGENEKISWIPHDLHPFLSLPYLLPQPSFSVPAEADSGSVKEESSGLLTWSEEPL